MDIIKRLAKLALKKAQRVRNPEALGAWLSTNPGGRNPNKTGMYAIAEGVKRNEWNSPEGLEGAGKKYAAFHGTSTKKKKGHKYSDQYDQGQHRALSATEREDSDAGDKAFRARYKIDAKKVAAKKGAKKPASKPKAEPTKPKKWSTAPKRVKARYDKLAIQGGRGKKSEAAKYKQSYLTPKGAPKKGAAKKGAAEKGAAPTTKPESKKTDVEPVTPKGLISIFDKPKSYPADVEATIIKRTKKPIDKLDGYLSATPTKRKAYSKLYREANQAANKLSSILFTDDKKAFQNLLKPIADLQNLRADLSVVKKSMSSSRRLLNILKSTATVENDQIEKDFMSALNQAMNKHSNDFSIPTGNTLLKTDEKREMKKGIGSALLAVLAGYALTPKFNPGEMTPAQQRQWERTLANQMRKKNIDLDSDTFKALQNFYKDQSDTYTRRKPAENGVTVEKMLSIPPFQGAEFDQISHRWKKPGRVAAQTGTINVGTGGRRRVRGGGTGGTQRSVGGHSRGQRRYAGAGRKAKAATDIAASKAKKAGRVSRIKAYKKLTRRKK